MKKLIIFIFVLAVILGAGLAFQKYRTSNIAAKIYVAAEGEGKIAVIDPASNKVIKNIDLKVEHEGGTLSFFPHNVQVAPDGETVWVTANAGKHEGHSRLGIKAVLAHGETEAGDDADQVIVISARTDRIAKRLPIAKGIQLAHVALTPDSRYAYVTAQGEGVVYRINAATFTTEKEIAAPSGSQPHGIRIAPDGSKAYVAMLTGKGLGILNLDTETLEVVPLEGQAVQTGVTPNGKFAVASLYDTKKLAVYNTGAGVLSYVDLPPEAKGPIQMYPTPDSRFMYLADQGYYFGQPTSDKVYKIDLEAGRVAKAITAGQAPHGVVVSKDGKFVYVTNLLSGDISIIDTASDAEVGRIAVGREPNGISFWSKK